MGLTTGRFFAAIDRAGGGAVVESEDPDGQRTGRSSVS
jgi:hypothetical protein